MKTQEEILSFIRAGIMPATGCTEPGAVALAAAHACQALGGVFPDAVTVSVDPNVYKNGLAVGVPGTGQVGLPIAAALGVVIARPERKLAILSELTAEHLAAARRLLDQERVTIKLKDTQGLHVEAEVFAGTNVARAVIQGGHTCLVLLQVNGEDRLRTFQDSSGPSGKTAAQQGEVSLHTLLEAIDSIPDEELVFLSECVSMNRAAAGAGLTGRLGMAVGANFQDLIHEKLLADDLAGYAKVMTAAGADARMSGENIPVMSVAGSGNHGLTAILPVAAVAERLHIPEQRLYRALAVSIAVTLYIKRHTGGLSALCGCAVAAATGASAAIVWLLGGSEEQIAGTVKNMVANLTGMICDGGKAGCALKLSTAAGVAVETALLTLRNVVVPCSNGIIFPSADLTIRNLGMVSNPGMLYTDKIILDIMLEKGKMLSTEDKRLS